MTLVVAGRGAPAPLVYAIMLQNVAFLAGSRPNCMKVFQGWKRLATAPLPIHKDLFLRGQPGDALRSEVSFRDLDMPNPSVAYPGARYAKPSPPQETERPPFSATAGVGRSVAISAQAAV